MLQPSTDAALLDLLRTLQQAAYRFTAVTPATHERVIGRTTEARDLRGVFGWNLPFRPDTLPADLLDLLLRAEALDPGGDGLFKSRFRVASICERLFLHSAFPTDDEDSVFFGPDTYRFAEMIRAELPRISGVRRLVDIGTGSGAGGLAAAPLLPGARITLADVNREALRLAAINARYAGIEAEFVESEGLEDIAGAIDLVIANPPYIMDDSDRTYRHGGGMHGAELSLDWAFAAAERLERGGHMLLYTGVAMVDGHDALREALERELPARGCTLRYREIDPDIFGEELEKPAYQDVERIAAVSAVIRREP